MINNAYVKRLKRKIRYHLDRATCHFDLETRKYNQRFLEATEKELKEYLKDAKKD